MTVPDQAPVDVQVPPPPAAALLTPKAARALLRILQEALASTRGRSAA